MATPQQGGKGRGGERSDRSERRPREARESEFIEDVVKIYRVAKVVKGGRVMGWRLALAWALKADGRVRLSAIHKLLQLNRKTAGDNQQRPDRWAELDDALDEQLEHLREAIYRDGSIDFTWLDDRLKYWVKRDPELRSLEQLQRAANAAALEAEQAAVAAKARARAKSVTKLSKTLKGVRNKTAIVAAHKGAPVLAQELSGDGLRLLSLLVRAEAKETRLTENFYVEKKELGEALEECIALGLAIRSAPYLSKSAADPAIYPSPLGVRVYQEAVASKRIVVAKKTSVHTPRASPIA